MTPFLAIVRIAEFEDFFATLWLFAALRPNDQSTLMVLEVIWLTKAMRLSRM
jgi:hypothetical protein